MTHIKGLFEPLNVRADGTVVFAAPAGHAKIPLQALNDLGWYWRKFQFPIRHVRSCHREPAVYKAQSVEEWWTNFDDGVNRFIGNSSMTVKQYFSGFWNIFRDELVPRDMAWIRSVHPGTRTLEDWMRENNYTGGGGTALKIREDNEDWGINPEVTRKL
ncbi:hypothetical protein B0H13DRAFT_1884912 [Mycena leptocephala]|nr:hypothetical protein B0H13DRAFT_1884912 [Mycena leptocephala]